ncbi:MAG: tRNA guanosine(34) transglycosylase Tgt [Candidatus Diapherotrites archaeon]|nr:tRNA guanosine(34) transglycosylase Tgt [Candidatus Diapherotrites archaeon]
MQKFKIESVCGTARTGVLKTEHGEIRTPFFMPVATKGSVKLLSNEEVKSTGTQCIISNAFMIALKPGLKVIEKHGGLHEFMNWDKAIFTDSGGFQILSPNFLLKISDDKVTFRNPFNGEKVFFTPEDSIKIQNKLKSDVAMCLDDVPLAGADIERLKESAQRTALWANRCIQAHNNKKQLLFGICQGGTNKKLREKSAEEISEMNFDGVAIGGLAIGEPEKKMFEAAKTALKIIPQEKPRYLMGMGSVQELLKAIGLGVDLFDSAFPTRTARHGMAFSTKKNINIEKAQYATDLKPLDEKCNCFVCTQCTRAYIHHLVKTKEENGLKYLSYHNLFFVQNLMKEIRQRIIEGTFSREKSFP